MTTTVISPSASIALAANEILHVAERTAVTNAQALEDLCRLLVDRPRVFVLGAGRTGLALRMLAMRLMHFGIDAYVVGDTTTPALRSGDVLMSASGSGTTESVVRSATKASEAGARIVGITTDAQSPLAELADIVILVPAAHKRDRTGNASEQYAGSLFEQVTAVLGDGLFHALWHGSGTDAEELWSRHANLE